MRLLLRKQSGLFSKDYELLDKDSVICFMQFDDWKNCTAPGSLDTHLCYAAWRSSYSSRASIGV